MPPELQLLSRVEHSVYPLGDPTEPFLKLESADAEQRETAPPDIFSAAFHAQRLKLDWPPFAYVESRFRPSSVLDVGCGLGAYLKLFSDSGADVLGVDGFDWSRHHYISREEYLQADLARNALSLSNSYSVAIFVQVVEHLPIERSLAIIDEISSATMEAIVFSAAQPDQPGISHITLREPEFWLARFRENGWEPDVAGTISLRMLSTLQSFRRNLFLLVRKEKADPTRLGELIEFGAPGERAGDWKWPEHGSVKQ